MRHSRPRGSGFFHAWQWSFDSLTVTPNLVPQTAVESALTAFTGTRHSLNTEGYVILVKEGVDRSPKCERLSFVYEGCVSSFNDGAKNRARV
jgi:hypothetical protein